ncbi:MAG TPA: hypothetical protein VLH10_10500 [Yinghuangia sp.]|nr:hypothetical protein [Yinghuangia sp.]
MVSVAACGEDSDDNTDAKPKELAEEANDITREQRTVMVSGQGTDAQGTPQQMTACMAISPDGNTSSLRATMTVDGLDAEVVETGGKSYLKAPAEFWARQAGRTDPASITALASVVDGKFVVSESDGGQESVGFFDGNHDALVKGPSTDFNGTKAIPLSWTDADGVRNTVFVAAKGEPAVVGQVEEKGQERIETTVTGAGGPCDTTAPPQEQVITQRQVQESLRAHT